MSRYKIEVKKTEVHRFTQDGNYEGYCRFSDLTGEEWDRSRRTLLEGLGQDVADTYSIARDELIDRGLIPG